MKDLTFVIDDYHDKILKEMEKEYPGYRYAAAYGDFRSRVNSMLFRLAVMYPEAYLYCIDRFK